LPITMTSLACSYHSMNHACAGVKRWGIPARIIRTTKSRCQVPSKSALRISSRGLHFVKDVAIFGEGRRRLLRGLGPSQRQKGRVGTRKDPPHVIARPSLCEGRGDLGGMGRDCFAPINRGSQRQEGKSGLAKTLHMSSRGLHLVKDVATFGEGRRRLLRGFGPSQ
jgi:hypothetical protein